ncbi:MAG: winged helix-turn-helix domain-containing protein [Solirubrobacteraceae bacterium]
MRATMVEAETAGTYDAATLGMPHHLRVGIADRDSGFVQTLVKRLPAVAMEPVLAVTVDPDALIPQRLDALVLDVEIIGDNCWPNLERLCERLPALAVVVCTGSSSVAQRVRGLRVGVDAWVTKPCHPEELISVVGAVLRRQRRSDLPADNGPLTAGELTIRLDRYQAYVDQRSIELTAREFQLLLLLAQNDRVLERAEMYERVWGYAMAHGDRSVDVFVRKLRQKLLACSPGWTYIHTHFGIGYRFAPEPRRERLDKAQRGDHGEVRHGGGERRGELLAALR